MPQNDIVAQSVCGYDNNSDSLDAFARVLDVKRVERINLYNQV